MNRRLRSLAAATALVWLICGVPAALVLFGRSPLNGHGTLWKQLKSLPTETVSDDVAFGALTVAAWIAWAVFTLHVAVELAAASGAAVRWHIPAFGPVQFAARRLVAAVTMSLAVAGPLSHRTGAEPPLPIAATDVANPAIPHASPALPPTTPQAEVRPTPSDPGRAESPASARGADPPATVGRQPTHPASTPADRHVERRPEAVEPTIVVVPGDTPWGLAERHLGHGLRWREIWERNRGLQQADGRAWVSEDLIYPGWRFRLPPDATNLPSPPPEANDSPTTTPPDEPAPAPSDTPEAPSSSPDDADGHDARDEDSTDAATEDDSANLPTAPDDTGGLDQQDSAEPATTTTSTTQPGADDRPPAPPHTGDASETGQEDEDEDSGSSIPTAPLLGAAGTLLAVGVSRELRRRRTRRSTGLPAGAVPPPAPRVPVDRELLGRADEDTVDRLDTALAHLANSLRPRAGQECVQPRVVQVNGDRIDICMDRPDPTPPRPWRPEASGLIWVLDADQPLELLDQASPLPSLVTIGRDDTADILIDLEAHGVVALVGHPATCAHMARAMLTELSTRAESTVTTTVVGDIAEPLATSFNSVHTSPSWDDVDTSTISTSARLLDAGPWPHTWAARASGRVFDGWAPAIWISPPSDHPRYLDTLEAIATRPGAGSAIVVVGEDPGRGLRIHLSSDGRFRIPDLGVEGDAQILAAEVNEQIIDLLDDADSTVDHEDLVFPALHTSLEERTDQPMAEQARTHDALQGADEYEEDDDALQSDEALRVTSAAPTAVAFASGDPTDDGRRRPQAAADRDATYEEPAYDVLIRLCGAVRLDGGRSQLAQREAAVATYVALHGEASVEDIRDAVWAGVGVTRKRVSNVISTVRSSLREAITWTARGRLATGVGLRTDIELIQRRLAYAQHQDTQAKAEILQGGMDLVTGKVCSYPRGARRAWTWLEVDRWLSHVEAIVGTLTQQLATAYLDLGKGEKAALTAQQGIDAAGRRDELVILQVRGYELADDEASARAVMRSHERWLDELGVDELSEELLDLLDRYAAPVRAKRGT